MEKNSACLKCGSLEVIPAVLQPDAHAGNVFAWQGNRHCTVTARVCGKCGYTELFVANPEKLLSVKKK